MLRANYRRMNTRTLRLVFMALTALLVIVAALVLLDYFNIQRPIWNELARDERRALQETPMQEVTGSERYHGESAYTVVYGIDAEGSSLIAFVSDDSIQSLLADSGISREEASAKSAARRPGTKVLRAVPGILDDVIVWEVYARIPTDNEVVHQYDYFRFEDGTWVTSYTLGR